MKRVTATISLQMKRTPHRDGRAWVVGIVCLLLSLSITTTYAQDGPGGIGSTDGTSNLSLWLDAGTISGVSEGADISSWADQSGNGNNVVIGTAPSYSSAGGGNGRPAVYFDDTNSEYLYVNSNGEIFPTSEVSVFVASSYDVASDSWACLVSASSYDAWDDGWGIGEDSNSEDMLFYVEDYNTAGYFSYQTTIDNPAANRIYGLIYNTTSNTGYGYRSEAVSTFSGFMGALSYDAGGNDNLLIGVGPDDAGPAYFMTGHIEEIILYDAALNDAERIILNNYLSAKYDIALSANDIYNKDNAAQGDFDHHVAGIGRVNASNIHDDSQGTGIVRVSNPTNLNNGEFFFWGFDNGELAANNLSDIPAGVEARFVGQWRVSERNTSLTAVNVGSVHISFDLDGMGDIDPDDLVLLVDTDNDGTYADETAITGATLVSGNTYQFPGVSTITNNDRFTLGTADRAATPLLDLSGAAPNGPGGVGSTDGSSNLSLWLDADAITGVSNTAELSTWVDQSGNGNNATATSSLADPNTAPHYYSTAGGNSRPTVRFDGVNNDGDAMEVAGNSEILPTEELSVFWAGHYDNGDNWASVLFAADDDNWDDGWGFGRENGTGNINVWVEDYANPGVQVSITDYGTNHIWGLVFNTTDDELSAYKSEATPVTATFAGPINYDAGGGGKNDNLLIGRSYDRGEHFQGDISEIIEYDVAVNDAQRIIIANYLSAKYAINLTNYNVYNEDNAGAGDYDYEVAGIGQAADGSNHTDAQGGIIRMLNPTDLGNSEFMMWGHNNGAMTATEYADVPTGVDSRLVRTWRVSEHSGSGAVDVGAVDIWCDLSAVGTTDTTLLRLLVDTDNDGVFSDETPIRGSYLVTGNTFRFLGVDAITNNDRFTFGFIEAAPGHITANLEVWLKSNDGLVGGATVTGWEDKSSQGNDATASGGPTYVANGINYNPAVDFDGASDYLSTTATGIIGDNNAYTKYAVVISDDITAGRSIIASDPSGDHDMRHTNTGDLRIRHGGTNWGVVSGFVQGQPHIVGIRYGVGGPDNMSTLDGLTNTNTTTYNFTDGGAIELGTRNSGAALFDGYIAEAIVYNSEKDDTEVSKIETYLAVKYSITLDNSGGGTDGDYVASDGSTVWDADNNAGYHNSIIALGRDDNSKLDQRQSRSMDDSLRVYVGSLAADNASNTGSISSDISYLVIGHNGERLSSAWDETEMPATVTARFLREWKITNVNFADTWGMEIEWEELGAFDINDIRLLVDSDGDFSNATILGPADGLTFTQGSIIVDGLNSTHIPANTTSYVTVASVGSTPLPIELINFDATVIDDGRAVQLDWATASEIDNDFFTVERSYNNIDWKPVLILPGAGTSNEVLEYTAYDDDPLYGLSYYRLKQTDFDGQFTHSELREVTIGEFAKEMTVYPNPTQGELHVKGDPEELASIEIVFLSGQRVQDGLMIKRVSPTEIRLDVSGLPTGIYTLRTRSRAIKFIKR